MCACCTLSHRMPLHCHLQCPGFAASVVQQDAALLMRACTESETQLCSCTCAAAQAGSHSVCCQACLGRTRKEGVQQNLGAVPGLSSSHTSSYTYTPTYTPHTHTHRGVALRLVCCCVPIVDRVAGRASGGRSAAPPSAKPASMVAALRPRIERPWPKGASPAGRICLCQAAQQGFGPSCAAILPGPMSSRRMLPPAGLKASLLLHLT